MSQSRSHGNVVNRICLLIGWLGCRTKHMKLYETQYKRIGYHDEIVSFIPSTHGLLLLPISNRKRKSELHSILHKLQNTQHSVPMEITLHAFSNNGFWFLAQLLPKLIQNSKFYPKTIILDSAPALVSSDIAVSAFESYFKMNSRTNEMLNHFIMEFIQKLSSNWIERFNVKVIENDILHGFEKCLQSKQCKNVLVMGSRSDVVIKVDHMKWFIKRWKELDSIHVRIDSCLEFDAPHVDLFRSNPEKYLRCIRSVLER